MCVAVTDSLLNEHAGFRWKRRWRKKRRGQGRSFALCRCRHTQNVCVCVFVWDCKWVCVCVSTWCIIGTKTEQRPGQQTCSGRERRKVTKERRKETDSGTYLDTASIKLLKLQHQHLQHSLSSFFARRPKSDYGQPQVHPKWDHFSQRYFHILIFRIKDLGTWLCVIWDWPNSKEWSGHFIVLLCLHRQADREGCPTQALFEKQWKLRISSRSDTFSSASTIMF